MDETVSGGKAGGVGDGDAWNRGPRVGRLAGAASALVGIGLLVLIAPHTNPWDMTRVHSRGVWGSFRLDIFGPGVDLSLPLLLLLALLLGALALVRRRRGSGHDGPSPPEGGGGRGTEPGPAHGLTRPLLLALLAYLLLTLLPSEEGWEIILNLVLGSLGVVLAAVGLVRLWPTLGPAVERGGRRILSVIYGAPTWAFLGILFLWVFGATVTAGGVLFHHQPHIVDSIVQLFHARIMVLGRIAVPPPVPLESFDLTHMISDGAWYSQYPPGHTLLLAAGQLLGIPWVVNPLFGALSVLLLYFIGREAYDEPTGRLSGLLGALSPFLLLMSTEFMNHTTTGFFLLLFVLGVVRWVRRRGVGNAALAGLALGYAFAIRPLTAAAVGAPFAAYVLVVLVRRLAGDGRRGDGAGEESRARGPGGRALLSGLVALIGFALPVAGLLAFNQATNGDPLLFGYEALHGADARPGFGHSGFRDTPHTPRLGWIHTLRNFNALNQFLFGLPFPSLLLPFLGLALVGRGRRKAWDGLFLASLTLLALAYFFYWYQDWALGPRFYYSAVGPLVLLTARGLRALPGALASMESLGDGGTLRHAVYLGLGLSAVWAWTAYVPSLADFYSRSYFDGNTAAVEAVEADPPEEAVVFVPPFYYPSFFPRNDPLLESSTVYARDLGLDGNRAVMERFPGRRFYKLYAFEDYRLLPYPTWEAAGDRVYSLSPGSPLLVEALSSQVSFVRGFNGADAKTGELGSGWSKHDHLRVYPVAPEAELGFLFQVREPEVRPLTVAFTRAPNHGAVEVWLNDTRLALVDLYAPEPSTGTITLEEAALVEGRNALTFRIAGKNELSAAAGMGLDYVRLGPS